MVVTLFAASSLVLRGADDHRAHLSGDLLEHQSRRTLARTRVIVHGSDAELSAIAARHHLQIVRRLGGAAVVVANSDEIAQLAADLDVDHLSGDARVRTTMTVSNQSTGADQVRAGTQGLLLGIGAIPGVTGQGIGVAIIDSGIAPHSALGNRVVANVSFVTGEASATDAYGHGTHVAGIVSGSPAGSVTNLYNGGVAPGAKLINIRVLGADGSGLTSDVIAGIDWAIAQKEQYNIRVINLSLGHPVMEPSATDPLCEAVERASQAGIVVVAAAGNAGVTDDGRRILGGIMSPGNSPYAITVGSLNTMGTVTRSDDALTTYSSRGPTRFDFAVKPDVAAPGNKIVSLEASGSHLASTYTYLHRAGSGSNAYMQLSGTSMAAPMVTGAVALLLQGTPGMNPSQIKLVLQMGAAYMPEAGLIGAGAGSVNFMASRKNAANGLSSAVNTVVGGVLSPSSGAAFWDKGTLAHRLYTHTGLRLLSLLELPLALLNPSYLHYGELNLLGLNNPLAQVPANRLVWGEVAGWTSSQDEILWGTTVYDQSGDEILWGTSGDDEILWGTATVAPDPR
jgi:serine protease AprX